MKPIEPKIRPPRKTHGGKFYEARDIVGAMRPHVAYLEDFGGGASVLLNKPKSQIEIYNDLDWLNANVFACMRSKPAEMIRELSALTYTEATFRRQKEIADVVDAALTPAGVTAAGWDVSIAVATIARSRMSRGGLGSAFAWSDRLRGGMPGDLNGWKTFVETDLPLSCERVADVEIKCEDGVALFDNFCEVMRGKNAAGKVASVAYRDPPYIQSTRSHKTTYGRFEFGLPQHNALVDQTRIADVDVIVSGYFSETYDRALSGENPVCRCRWRRFDKEVPNRSGQTKSKNRRVECLWINFDPLNAPFQQQKASVTT